MGSSERGRDLRRILQKEGILVVPGVYDCLGARLAEQAGFEAVFTSGFGLSAALLGRPDFGLLTAGEVVSASAAIAQSVSIPVVADLDTGYGNPLNVIRTVKEAIRGGIAGFILEDQVWPKKCGHFEGKRVIPTDEHVLKIRAAVEARGDSGAVIVGRTDARASLGLEEAIRRGQAYREAGADVVFVEAPQSLEELTRIPQAFPGTYVFANMIEGGRTPLLSARELEELGYKIVVFPLAGLFATTRAVQDCFRFLRGNGTTEGFKGMVSFAEFEGVVDLRGHRRLEKRFLSVRGSATGQEEPGA